MREILRGDAKIDFMGRIPLFWTVSAILVVGSIVLTAVVGLNFGIDFAGGYEIQAKFPSDVTDAQIKDVINPVVGDARVQRFGEEGSNEYLILVREHGTLTDGIKEQLRIDFEALAGSPEDMPKWSPAESGERIEVAFLKPITEGQVRDVLAKQDLTVKDVERGERADEPEYVISLVSLSDQIKSALVNGFELKTYDPIQRVEFVGPQVGAQLRNQGIMAILWALFFILLYIGVRFDLYFSPGAIIALVHDVAITVGIFALLQLEFNLPIIAAILAIVGYSLNDTIVVYDRIRENAIRLRGRDLRGLVNTSLNQTLSRTLLTSVTTLLVVMALLFFGGGIIRDFSVALMIGVIVGTYSSVGIASPVYVLMRERWGTGTTDSKSERSMAAAV